MRAGKGNVITPQRNHDILFIKLNVCFTWHWQPCLAMNLISPLFINEAVDLLLVLLYRDLPSHPSDWEIISAKSLTALTPTHSPCLPHAYGLCGLATVRILLQGKCWSQENDTKTQTRRSVTSDVHILFLGRGILILQYMEISPAG